MEARRNAARDLCPPKPLKCPKAPQPGGVSSLFGVATPVQSVHVLTSLLPLAETNDALGLDLRRAPCCAGSLDGDSQLVQPCGGIAGTLEARGLKLL